MNARQQYALWGAGFGICFPILGTVVQSLTTGVGLVEAQLDTPLLWIIDTAPFFLGWFASLAGTKQDQVNATLADLEVKAAELTAANHELLEARKLKGQFLANVSHELRTPLNAIIGFSRILRRKADGKLDTKQMQNIDRIHDSGIQLRDLVNDLLDIERIEAGMLAVNETEFDVVSLIEELIATIKPRAIEKGLKLELELESGVRVLRTDPNRLRQLISNLVVNAVKYSDQGTIHLRLRRANAKFVIAVEDEGIGIPAEMLPHIFEPFRQVDGSSTRSVGGVGLGLNLVKQLAEMLGGEVSVESTEGEGSVFELAFDDAMIVDAATADISERSEEIMPKEGAEGPVVLVIDDDDRALDIASTELTEAGFRVHVANSGSIGMDVARKLKPDVIVLDIVMPEMDGWSVLQELRQDEATSDIPVVVASFMDKVSDTNTGGLNIQGWMTKPFNMNEFRSFVSTLTARDIQEVLVVEDDPATLSLVVQSLESTGARIRTATDGPAALHSLRAHLPSAIVLDLMLPQVDGVGVLKYLRANGGADVPVIVYTAKSLTEDERLALNGGVVEVVQKSEEHSVDRVVSLISEAVRSTSAEAE